MSVGSITSATGCPFDRMSASILQGQHDHLVLLEVIFGKLHGAVEDRDHVLGFKLLGLPEHRARGTPGIDVSTFAVRNRCSFSPPCGSWQVAHPCPKSGLMKMRLLELIGLVGMAGQTSADRIRLQEAGRLAGMRIMASYAFSLSSGMLHLGLLDLFCLIAVAGSAERLRVGCW